MSSDIIKFMVEFASYVVDMADSIFYYMSISISQLVADFMPWDWLDSIILSILPSITFLELLVSSVGLVLAVSIFKWFKGLVTS